MMLRRLSCLLWFAAASAAGSTIDASGLVKITLHTGDELSFTISDQTYTTNAGRYGAPASPTGVSFSLVTAPSTDPLSFSAELQDQHASATFSNVAFDAGYLYGAAYCGPVTSIHGSLQLSEESSRAIFSGPAATLILRNTGGDVMLGLNPNTLPRDLQVTLSGAGLQAGAAVTGASVARTLDPEPGFVGALRKENFAEPRGAESVPEPSPASLLASAAIFGALIRFTRRSRRGAARQ